MSLGIVISFCDLTGVMVEPWVNSGYEAILVDPQHPSGVHVDGLVTRIGHIIDHTETWRVVRRAIQSGRVVAVFGFPPCTDVAVSGSRWFAAKREEDPFFQSKAALVAEQCRVIGQLSGVSWCFENPVSVFSSIFGKPQHTFHPYKFTGYCGDDNYTKQTCLWSGGGFVMPDEFMHESVAEAIGLVVAEFGRLVPKNKAVAAFPHDELIGTWYPDNRIHACPPSEERANIRSATPRGFALAVHLANAPHLRHANDNRGATRSQIDMDEVWGAAQ
ncbi:hypothetical protein D3C76_47730 [compost metagenome]